MTKPKPPPAVDPVPSSDLKRLEISMRPTLKTAFLLAAVVLITFVVTKIFIQRYTTREVIALMIAADQRIQAFNDVGRLEDYDTLAEFFRKGCTKEAQEFIAVKQSLLLNDISRRMKEDDKVADEVFNRSAAVAERSRAEALNRNPPRAVPRCR